MTAVRSTATVIESITDVIVTLLLEGAGEDDPSYLLLPPLGTR